MFKYVNITMYRVTYVFKYMIMISDRIIGVRVPLKVLFTNIKQEITRNRVPVLFTGWWLAGYHVRNQRDISESNQGPLTWEASVLHHYTTQPIKCV